MDYREHSAQRNNLFYSRHHHAATPSLQFTTPFSHTPKNNWGKRNNRQFRSCFHLRLGIGAFQITASRWETETNDGGTAIIIVWCFFWSFCSAARISNSIVASYHKSRQGATTQHITLTSLNQFLARAHIHNTQCLRQFCRFTAK